MRGTEAMTPFVSGGKNVKTTPHVLRVPRCKCHLEISVQCTPDPVPSPRSDWECPLARTPDTPASAPDLLPRSEAPSEAPSEARPEADLGASAPPPKTRLPEKTRLMALDAFRGITIVGMLLVNNVALDAATPAQLLHAKWNCGVTFADLVLPWFLLAAGVAIPFGGSKTRAEPAQYIQKVIMRTLLLFAMGCVVDSAIVGRAAVSMGVLQLIGLSYFIAAVLSYLPPWGRVGSAFLLLAIHYCFLRYFHVPGVGVGVLTETRGFVPYVNSLLNPYHLRGLFSVVSTSALVLFGSVAGEALYNKRAKLKDAAIDVLLLGLGLLGLGIVWGLVLPYSKMIWTSSYVLYTAGLGLVTLSALIVVVDVWKWHTLAFPLVVFGTNAIVAYVAPILIKVLVLQKMVCTLKDGSHLNAIDNFLHYCVAHFGRYPGGWVYTLTYIVVCWLVLLAMYRGRVFVRL